MCLCVGLDLLHASPWTLGGVNACRRCTMPPPPPTPPPSPRQRAVLLSGPTPRGTPTHPRRWEEWEGKTEMIKQGGVREKRTVIGGEKESWENQGWMDSVCVSLTFVGGFASHGTPPHPGLCCCLMATCNSTGDHIKSSFPQISVCVWTSDDDVLSKWWRSPKRVRAPVWWAVVLLIWM